MMEVGVIFNRGNRTFKTVAAEAMRCQGCAGHGNVALCLSLPTCADIETRKYVRFERHAPNPGAVPETPALMPPPSKAASSAPFDGKTYAPSRDGVRLRGQLAKVHLALSDGSWWGLKTLALQVGGSEAGVSARLRDLRKPRFGQYTIERRNEGGGVWAYRMVR